MRYVRDYPRSAYLLSTLEMAVLLRYIRAERRSEYIHIHVDDDPGSGRTGGHIYEGLHADCGTFGEDPAESSITCTMDQHRFTFKVAQIRTLDIRDYHFCHVDHPVVTKQFSHVPSFTENLVPPWFEKYLPDMWKHLHQNEKPKS